MFWSLVMVVKKNQLFNHPDTYALDHGSVWHHADKERKASPGLDWLESCAKNPTSVSEAIHWLGFEQPKSWCFEGNFSGITLHMSPGLSSGLRGSSLLPFTTIGMSGIGGEDLLPLASSSLWFEEHIISYPLIATSASNTNLFPSDIRFCPIPVDRRGVQHML